MMQRQIQLNDLNISLATQRVIKLKNKRPGSMCTETSFHGFSNKSRVADMILLDFATHALNICPQNIAVALDLQSNIWMNDEKTDFIIMIMIYKN
jgi:hypothetical protein